MLLCAVLVVISQYHQKDVMSVRNGEQYLE